MSVRKQRMIFMLLNVLLFCGLFWAVSAHAHENIIVTRDTAVYSRPNIENLSDYELHPGEKIEASDRSWHGYRHVLFYRQNRRVLAYVLESDFESWVLQAAASRWSFWAGPIYSYVYEAPRSLTTSLNASYSISTFTGSTVFYAVGGEYRVNHNWTFRFGYLPRSTSIQGSATEQDTGTVTNYRVDQNYFGALAGFNYTPDGWQKFRFETQVEYSKGNSISLTTLNGGALNTSDVQTSTIFELSEGIDFTYLIGRHFGIMPSLRLGAVASNNPVMVTADAEMDMIWRF